MPRKSSSIIEGRVVKVLSGDLLVANVGLENGVVAGDLFAVFELGEEIVDPETKESLGRLEKLRGHFVAQHVQPLMTQLSPKVRSSKDAPVDARAMSAMMNETGSHRPLRSRSRPPGVQVGDGLRLLPPRQE